MVHAEVVNAPFSLQYSVGVHFTSEAGPKMLAATQAHIGRPMAVLIDNEVVMAPIIRDQVGDAAVITGTFTKSEAERIVAGVQ